MKQPFDPVFFDRGDPIWYYKGRADQQFRGFYHWHQCCEILLVHEGRGTVIVNQVAHEIRRGMMFFFQPYQLHNVHADVSMNHPYVRTVIYLDPIMTASLLTGFPRRSERFRRMWQEQSAQVAYDLEALMQQVEWLYDHAYERMQKADSAEDWTMFMLQLVQHLERAADSTAAAEALSVNTHRPLRYAEAIMQWIEQHYAEDFSLDRLADEMHLSKFYVSRVFRLETGSSITDYVTARRMKQACRLLRTTTLPVERIGIEVGLPNVSYFIAVFKKIVGTTPLKYRSGD
ncbi:YesN/AraC family two-component response regulator [Paenibacillus phyllosphaerae]|uniref:YesN/AraC family two-component response regulator n=1 Tax=Paenibacillus phyllosphaerae TaxID=274593 RepID=A0A7W5FM06_9BACL|nr:AraC family transcriptional regulator [Paenibacillus phyllosphaerae]MBB3109795.1 YesN/AraC family two-component response regulator [Paenibacillus phyllosphaerae]